MSKNRILIFDTTLRDGEQCPGASMNLREKLAVARQLGRLKVDVIEAGFPVISWSLNTAAKANLALGITGSSSGPGASIHTITLSNAGPQSATGVSVTINMPSGASYLSGSAGCLPSGMVVICNVGTLASGANAVLSVNLSWSTGGVTASISASVTSELPDPVAADNTQVSEVALSNVDGDVPTLPEWGMIVLLILLGSLSLLGPVRGACRW